MYSTQLTCQPAPVDRLSHFSKAFPLPLNCCNLFPSFFQTNSILFADWHVIWDRKGLAIVDYLAHSFVIWQRRGLGKSQTYFLTTPELCLHPLNGHKNRQLLAESSAKASDVWFPFSFSTFTGKQKPTTQDVFRGKSTQNKVLTVQSACDFCRH